MSIIWKPVAMLSLGLAASVILWAVFIYGPQQRKDAETAIAAKLFAASIEASKGLINDADRADFAFTVCRASGGVYVFASGECER